MSEELQQFTANRGVGDYRFVAERRAHRAQPCIPFALANGEAVVRFAQAQPPPALRSIGLAPEELDQKRRKLFNRAPEGRRKQGTKYGILLHMSIERRRQRTASGSAPNGAIEFCGHGQEPLSLSGGSRQERPRAREG
ncbi:MAG TPA: hypothetical protein VN841_15385 [Bryobacteraceae bacterium]|nr:hypothetical protein [Bryobacteraceae bacterium]